MQRELPALPEAGAGGCGWPQPVGRVDEHGAGCQGRGDGAGANCCPAAHGDAAQHPLLPAGRDAAGRTVPRGEGKRRGRLEGEEKEEESSSTGLSSGRVTLTVHRAWRGHRAAVQGQADTKQPALPGEGNS